MNDNPTQYGQRSGNSARVESRNKHAKLMTHIIVQAEMLIYGMRLPKLLRVKIYSLEMDYKQNHSSQILGR